MRLEIRPITVKGAQKIVRKWHHHLARIQGGLRRVLGKNKLLEREADVREHPAQIEMFA